MTCSSIVGCIWIMGDCQKSVGTVHRKDWVKTCQDLQSPLLFALLWLCPLPRLCLSYGRVCLTIHLWPIIQWRPICWHSIKTPAFHPEFTCSPLYWCWDSWDLPAALSTLSCLLFACLTPSAQVLLLVCRHELLGAISERTIKLFALFTHPLSLNLSYSIWVRLLLHKAANKTDLC